LRASTALFRRIAGFACQAAAYQRLFLPPNDIREFESFLMDHPVSCRFCGHSLRHIFVDLGMSPLCQSHISADQLSQMEPFYPLRTYVCERCFLVQLEEFVSPRDIFSEYAYFSSYADSWVEHARQYCLSMSERFGIGPASRVIEIASNDGYLLQHFVARGIPVLGVEPSENVAAAAGQTASRRW
jgi:hypothetical protein